MSAWVALVLLALAGVALLLRGESTNVMGLEPQEFAALASVAGLLLLTVPPLLSAYRGRLGTAVRDIMTWCAIGLMLVAGYSFRDEITQIGYRIAGELSPPGGPTVIEQGTNGERAVRIRRRSDGHFVATVGVNGSSVPMLVDTGASTVVLRQADARKLGIETSQLKYTVPVQTANGLAYAAHVRLRSLGIGPITINGIDALVAQPGVLRESLLGMSFLSRLRSYEFSGNFVTFRN